MNKREIQKKKIGVLLGGKSSERKISLMSGNAVLQSLERGGYNAVGIDVDRNLPEILMNEGIEIAFIALHGRWGEDGTVQGLLEVMGIPYTGSGVLGSSISMDKVIMKFLLNSIGIPTPPYAVYNGRGVIDSHGLAPVSLQRYCHIPWHLPPGSSAASRRRGNLLSSHGEREGEAHTALPGEGATRAPLIDFPVPFVVKPANEGSTIGISIVRQEDGRSVAIENALRYDKKLLVERYVEGDEITVGMVNGRVLPVVHVKPSKGFYDFEAKYTKGMTEYIVPAKIEKKVERRACDMAKTLYKTFELAGCARIDMLVEEGIPQVIDVNTSPGMTETSLVPKAWAHLGKTFDQLIENILMGASLKT